MTNFEKIKDMSIDNMAMILCILLYVTNDDFNPCTLCRYYDDCDLNGLAFGSVGCLDVIGKWLESEVK